MVTTVTRSRRNHAAESTTSPLNSSVMNPPPGSTTTTDNQQTAPRRSTRNQSPSSQPPLRRSVRHAAMAANARIAECHDERKRKRPNNHVDLTDSPDSLESNPKKNNNKNNMAASLKLDEALLDFTCPICLDCPSSLNELASISGCTHRFCFDCIDTWATTENRCPCCKSRFHTINRVEPIVTTTPGRRGKRKRYVSSTSSSSSPRRGGRNDASQVNSRRVEDRNQPSGMTMNVAFIEQILQQFATVSAEHGGNVMSGVFAGAGGGGPSFRFSNVNGNPVMRIERPGGNGAHMELFLAATEGEGGRPGRGRVRYSRGSVNAVGGGTAGSTEGGDDSPPPPLESVGRGGVASSARSSSSISSTDAVAAVRRSSPFRFRAGSEAAMLSAGAGSATSSIQAASSGRSSSRSSRLAGPSSLTTFGGALLAAGSPSSTAAVAGGHPTNRGISAVTVSLLARQSRGSPTRRGRVRDQANSLENLAPRTHRLRTPADLDNNAGSNNAARSPPTASSPGNSASRTTRRSSRLANAAAGSSAEDAIVVDI
eukprot:scaffold43858_cov67-Cyclotella_meneghiniana.AAC.7